MRLTSITRDDGFSLIEIFIAMGIFAIGSFAVVTLYYYSSGNIRHDSILTDATFLAEKHLANTLALKYSGVNAMKSTEILDFAGGDSPQYTVVINVKYLGADEDTALITVSVTPSYEFVDNIFNRSVDLQFLRARTSSSGI